MGPRGDQRICWRAPIRMAENPSFGGSGKGVSLAAGGDASQLGGEEGGVRGQPVRHA